MKTIHHIEGRTLALVIGFGIGLGLAVHELWFVVVLAATAIAVVQAVGEYVRLHHRPRMKTSRGSAYACAIISGAAILALVACARVYATNVHPATGERSGHTAKAMEEVERGPTGKSEIAITFDAGSNAECFEDLIAALESAHVHSTFFITGNWAQRNRECAAAITKKGHEIGNHTWNHLDLTKQSDDVVREEIVRADSLLNEVAGQSPRPHWRAPFGARDDRVLGIAAKLGYRSIYWTIDSLDSAAPPKTSDFLVQRITGKTDAQLDGAIILMHVGERATADALPPIIADLQGRGFRLVTVSELLRGR